MKREEVNYFILWRKEMERGDVKRRRRAMEAKIVDRIEQNLPLTRDAMEYLLRDFDLRSLNRMQSSSNIVKEFFASNEIWRKKFLKLISRVDLASNPLKTSLQWLAYWDEMHTQENCPNGYRLLVAFLILFDFIGGRGFIWMSNEDRYQASAVAIDVEFILIDKDTRRAVVRNGMLNPMIEDEIAGGYIRWGPHFDSSESFDEFTSQMNSIGWRVALENRTYWFKRVDGEKYVDVVKLLYDLLGIRAYPIQYPDAGVVFNESKSRYGYFGINSECAHCAAPNPQGICGLCDQVMYCNQKCANSHWADHKCDTTI